MRLSGLVCFFISFAVASPSWGCINIDQRDPIGAATMMRDAVHLSEARYVGLLTMGPLYETFFSRTRPGELRSDVLAGIQRAVREAGFFPQEARLDRVIRSRDTAIWPDQYVFVSEAARGSQRLFRFDVRCFALRGAPTRPLRGINYPRFEGCRVNQAYVYRADGTLRTWLEQATESR